MNMTESEKKLWLEGDSGLTPYLRLKDNGMPQNKINQIAWLLLNGSGCGFCKVCRDEPCNIQDGEKCTTNIANYIRKIVLEETEQEIRTKAIDEFANYLHKKAKENNGLRLSSETRSWTHSCVFDYLKEFKEEQAGIAEEMRGAE